MEWARDNYRVSCDTNVLDRDFVARALAKTYWAKGIPPEVVHKSLEGSICFALLAGNRQIGFARVISDRATIAYLGDVFVVPEFQGRGAWHLAHGVRAGSSGAAGIAAVDAGHPRCSRTLREIRIPTARPTRGFHGAPRPARLSGSEKNLNSDCVCRCQGAHVPILVTSSPVESRRTGSRSRSTRAGHSQRPCSHPPKRIPSSGDR